MKHKEDDYQEYELDQYVANDINDSDLIETDYAVIQSGNSIDSFSNLIQRNQAVIGVGMDTLSKVTDLYAESQRLNAQVEIVKEVGKVKLANIAAKYQLSRQIIEETFSERKTSLNHFYKELDKAIDLDDTERIVNAMKCISNIVTSSPLEDIQQFIARFEATSQPLLDF